MLAWLDPCGIPVDPDGAAWPWARPLFRVVRTRDPFGILAERRDPRLQIEDIWLSHPFGFLTGALPKLKQFPERKHMVCDVLAHPNVPAVVLANMNAKRVRPH